MSFLPIKIETLYEDQIDQLIVGGTLIRDFGPWPKGTITTLTFDLMSGMVTEHDDSGAIIKKAELELLAIRF